MSVYVPRNLLQTEDLTMFFFAALATMAVLVSFPQDTGSSCNNLSRTIQVGAGTGNVVTQDCGSVTLTATILGQSVTITTPATCIRSLTIHSNDVFSCGPAATSLNCTAHGEKVTVKVMVNDQPCPTIPDTMPTTMKAVRALQLCGTLTPYDPEHPSYDWSASVTDCKLGNKSDGHMDGQVITTPFDTYTVRLGDPTSLLSPATPNVTLQLLESLQTLPLSEIPEPLRTAMTTHAQIAGAKRITGQVQSQYFDGDGAPTGTTTASVNGKVAADGRFSITRSYTCYGPQDEVAVLTEDLVHDGATFFIGTEGNSFYNAYASVSPEKERQSAAECSEFGLLLDWAYSPFYFTRFPGTSYDVTPGETPSQSIVTESYAQFGGDPAQAGHTVYTIDSSEVPHPVRVEFRDSSGGLESTFEYSDFRTLAPGVWRPFKITETRFSAASGVPSLLRTLSISTAALLEQPSAENFARPVMPVERWFVRN